MLSYIKGEIIDIEEDLLILESNDIGYNIRISGQTASNLPSVGNHVKIYTYMHVREDAIQLFGFISKDDLNVFKLLIGVSGIGPKGALGILSVLSADDIRFAVLSDDVKTISKAPGIGTKTAQRMIIELKDKLKLEDAFEQKLENNKQEGLNQSKKDGAKGEAVLALTALGYSNSEALKAVKEADITEDMDSETILKAALKKLSFL
ncbi:Holliday junction branch migration protein RuvA [Candidatus Galacturonibacter soehngenii]|uniref:Holliday junction branch migration complex subunit RuvA n=1 Tax=Candidatus Galacturonatibacter soehngenii TaxID=2307010 RepID=A0A7V7UCW4_9FIRM|nr:Holliday junction branch migration protein RuvA [Candidatus Galacturonibacter soehngenii]KAB1439787.1 Holliday junction branch migration protein RuvA [Candidatus Galacturonibacter soehngenii]MBA4689021.1 Holliday junction branch migration protein RuvA [Candidatus Galacturonibacter soehngenii]